MRFRVTHIRERVCFVLPAKTLHSVHMSCTSPSSKSPQTISEGANRQYKKVSEREESEHTHTQDTYIHRRRPRIDRIAKTAPKKIALQHVSLHSLSDLSGLLDLAGFLAKVEFL